jgi:hypothetical protein
MARTFWASVFPILPFELTETSAMTASVPEGCLTALTVSRSGSWYHQHSLAAYGLLTYVHISEITIQRGCDLKTGTYRFEVLENQLLSSATYHDLERIDYFLSWMVLAYSRDDGRSVLPSSPFIAFSLTSFLGGILPCLPGS